MNRISRRNFAKHAVVIAGAAAVLPEMLAQNPPAVDAAPDAASTLASASRAEVDARVSWIVNKHGVRLSAEQRNDIRRLITGAQPGLEAMRAWDLGNAIEPATPFRIWRADRDGTTAARRLEPVPTHELRTKE